MRRPLAVLSLVLISGSASADGTLLYGELLGKGGPWGVGVEQPITRRLALGAVVSFAQLDGQQLYTAAPYVHARLWRGLFGELGVAIVHSRIPSPVMSWSGTSDTGAGGIATLGWEWALGERVVIRAYGALEVGEGGVAPWLGSLVGVRL